MIPEKNKHIQPWTLKALRDFSKAAKISWSREVKLEANKYVIWAEEMDQGFGPRGIYHLFDLRGNQIDIQITTAIVYPTNNLRPGMETTAHQGPAIKGKVTKVEKTEKVERKPRTVTKPTPKTKAPAKKSKTKAKTPVKTAAKKQDGRKKAWSAARKKAQGEKMRAYWAARKKNK